jgi:hypothetical protein
METLLTNHGLSKCRIYMFIRKIMITIHVFCPETDIILTGRMASSNQDGMAKEMWLDAAYR